MIDSKDDLFIPIGNQCNAPKGPFFTLGQFGYHDVTIQVLSLFIVGWMVFFVQKNLFAYLMNILPPNALISSSTLYVFSFIIPLGAVYFVVTKLQKRPFVSVLTGEGKFRKTLFFKSILIWGFMYLVSIFVATIVFKIKVTYVWDPIKWGIQFIPITIACLIQTGTEEIIFRGFIPQLFVKSKVGIVLAITFSLVLFTLIHIPNIILYGGSLAYPVFFFLFAAVLTFIAWKSNGIEMCMGIHFINNWIGFIIATTQVKILSDLETIVLIEHTDSTGYISLGLFIILALVFIMVMTIMPNGFARQEKNSIHE